MKNYSAAKTNISFIIIIIIITQVYTALVNYQYFSAIPIYYNLLL